MPKENFTTQQIQALFTAYQHDMINVDDVLKKVDDMNNQKILEQHKEFCSIWQASDGRWKTKLPDATRKDGKRLLAKASKEKLEAAIIQWYKNEQSAKEKPNTLKTLFPKWIKFKEKETSDGNANKLEWVWDKYYANSELINIPIADIKVITLKEWFIDIIEQNNLTQKKFKEMKSLLNMLLDYAIEYDLVKVNVSRSVRGISKKKFYVPPKKAPEELVYVDGKENLIIKLAEEQYAKTKNIAYLGVCLNFSLALRVGELVALHTLDFNNTTVKISRQEIKTYYVDANGKRHRNGYTLSAHTKTLMGTRELYLSENSKKYYQMIIAENKRKGFSNDYLLLDDNGNRLHDYAINNVLRRLNKKIQTEQKGNHSIRRTCISKMIESKVLTNEEIRLFAGHEERAFQVLCKVQKLI